MLIESVLYSAILNTLHKLFMLYHFQTPLCNIYLYIISCCADLYCSCPLWWLFCIGYGAFRP